MLMLPVDLSQQFNELLTRKSFTNEAKSIYLKWLRFYWDFCDKYHYKPPLNGQLSTGANNYPSRHKN